MACVADRIMAAPFAVIGSIGVIGQMPNFNRLLKNLDIDFEQVMAGEYKRTLTVFGENTDKDRQKAREEVAETHQMFKDFVREHRPAVDIEVVATGEHDGMRGGPYYGCAVCCYWFNRSDWSDAEF